MNAITTDQSHAVAYIDKNSSRNPPQGAIDASRQSTARGVCALFAVFAVLLRASSASAVKGEWQAYYVEHRDDLVYDRKLGKYTIHAARRPK